MNPSLLFSRNITSTIWKDHLILLLSFHWLVHSACMIWFWNRLRRLTIYRHKKQKSMCSNSQGNLIFFNYNPPPHPFTGLGEHWTHCIFHAFTCSQYYGSLMHSKFIASLLQLCGAVQYRDDLKWKIKDKLIKKAMFTLSWFMDKIHSEQSVLHP